MDRTNIDDDKQTKIALYWIPLGAGGHFVKLNGKIYEAISARLQHRKRQNLYHAALQTYTPTTRYVIEQAPVINNNGSNRGVVSEGPVFIRSLGRFRMFRYENRCWQGGNIPDISMAEESPIIISHELKHVKKIIEIIPSIPTAVWGRDELNTGEMWNSNSLISWSLTMCGIEASSLHPPQGGGAPGWEAGIVAAKKHQRMM